MDKGTLRGEQEHDTARQLSRGQHGDAPHSPSAPPFRRGASFEGDFERRRRMPSNIASLGTLLDTLPHSAGPYRGSCSSFSNSLDHDSSHGPVFDLTERSYERRPSGLYDRSSGLYKIPGMSRQGSVGDSLWGSVNKPRQRISFGAAAHSQLPDSDALDGRANVDSTGLPPSHVDDPLGAPSLERAKLHAEQLLPHLPYSPEDLFPLNTTFEAFGVGIYTYMKARPTLYLHCICT